MGRERESFRPKLADPALRTHVLDEDIAGHKNMTSAFCVAADSILVEGDEETVLR